MTHTTVVIPLRGLHGGKSRLSPVLDPEQRSAIIAAMARHVVGAVLESKVADSIVIVSRETDLLFALQICHPMVSLAIQATGSIGMNSAVDAGRQEAPWRAERLVVLSADLPLLEAADLAAMRDIEHDVVIVPDRFGVGTNAIMLRGRPAISTFQFHFGPESRRLHEAQARRLCYHSSVFETWNMALDLDTPEDWEMLTPDMRRWLYSSRAMAHCSPASASATDAMAILERA